MRRYTSHLVVSFLLIVLSSCNVLNNQGEILLEERETTPVPSATITVTPQPSATLPPTITNTPTVTPIVVLDPPPVEINFSAEDGQLLSGIYYPADANPAPLVILVHWARGDQTEWTEIALWLQNRSQFVREPNYNKTWRSSDWFPENSLGYSLGVFTFTLRDCEKECKDYLPGEWLLDIQAAMDTALELTGVDKTMIVTAGASIGADGAVYGCATLNRSDLGECRGSYALSPGSLLTIPFEDIAGELFQNVPPRPIYCLYDLRDDAAVETCSAVPGARQVDYYGYIENHGFGLIQPLLKPDPLLLLLELLETAFSE
jgi:dienelactone hydrolase